jgi:hypothetical protein
MTQPQMYLPLPQHTAHNGLGTASFVLGLMSFALSFAPFGILLAFPAGLIGVGVGLGNLQRLSRHTASNKALTWIGIGLNLAAIVIGIVLTAVIWHANATSGI